MDHDATPNRRPTVADLTGDNALAKIARANWLIKKPAKVLPSVVDVDIWSILQTDDFSSYSLLLLEQLQALERYLWPGFTDEASNHHVLLLAFLINVKKQEQLPTWSLFSDNPEAFQAFFRRALHLSIDQSLAISVRTQILSFIVAAFQGLDNGLVRKECAPLVGIGIWHNLHSDTAREHHLSKSTQLQKASRAAGRKFDQADSAGQARIKFERSWFYTLVLDFLDKLYETQVGSKQDIISYCARFVEFLSDLQSQLPTRRYVNTLLSDLNLLAVIRLSPLYESQRDRTPLHGLVDLLAYFTYFPINDQTGQQLSKQEYDEVHNSHIARLQEISLRKYPEKLKLLVLANFGSLSQRDELKSHLEGIDDSELTEICKELGLRTQYPESSLVIQDRTFLTETFVSFIERKQLYSDRLRTDLPILPTEKTLYEDCLHEKETDGRHYPLPIPKLNLQYLTIGDFLYRSFVLYRQEALYGIRKHLEDTIKRLKPRTHMGSTRFDGFSKLAIPIGKPAIVEVSRPQVGQDSSSEVKAEVVLDVSRLQPGLLREWESLKPDDVLFLLSVKASDVGMANGHRHRANADDIGPKLLRCAEVIGVLDENGRPLKRTQERHDHFDGNSRPRQRRLLLRLDAAAYSHDKAALSAGGSDILDEINMIVRRRARENNFKPVLESIRQIAITDTPIPSWLQEVFLGYGDPASATYKRLASRLKTLDYRDTFLDWQHLIESLPGTTVEPDPTLNGSFPPPYVLESTAADLEPPSRPSKKRRRDQPEASVAASAPTADAYRVSTYKPPNHGPYPTDAPRLNEVRFTPAQIEAVTSGTQPGLTVILGPPGTGKTDVATQIINNIYHNFPQERTLLIAHSNQALNQLFQKIAALDIDERHLLRLGHGEEELETDANYSKAGRVDSFLERGARYLADVQRLAASIEAPGAHSNSCETAEYFDEVWIRPRWKRYWDQVERADAEDVVTHFPFIAFFSDAPQPLFPPEKSKAEYIDVAKGCERHIERIFSELADIRPFEILRHQRDKSNYLLIKEARIIAMTSTHAAIRRQEIASLGFHYDNVIVEEAAQITEIDNFVPFVMQAPRHEDLQRHDSRLRRIVLVGDHLQNSPVVSDVTLRTYANLEQSLFQRLIRLGVPHILLDAQGRARPSLAALYKWRYPQLQNLPLTSTATEFIRANSGFRYDYQFIDVPDYKGHGETEPTSHFIQNLGEAEYTVAIYQYMRLLGYPASKISILCTYAGQRALIRDVLAHRCKGNRLFGLPGWVGTVDKYQGEQNDYIILSLVRTKSPGYLRDLRRLTVALSRARLGLYILGRREVFESSLELREAFALLFERNTKLALVTGEMFPASRGLDDEVEAVEMEGVEHLGQYVFDMTQAKVKALKEEGAVLGPINGTGGDERAGDLFEDDDAAEEEEQEEGEPGS